jgi:hypothetical protein
MPLNNTGAISLAGNTAGQSIALELGLSATGSISLNQADVRTLAGVPSGAIIMPTNFYGKSNEFTFTISTNQTDANLRTLAVSAGWNQSSAVRATVGSGVYISSTSTGTAGLTINGSWPGGVTLVNNGFIMGMGGTSGNTNGEDQTGNPAGAGGPAISLGVNVTIDNTNASAYIGGGGGSGGAGGWNNKFTSATFNQSGGGGAGGGGSGTVITNTGTVAAGRSGGGVGSAGTTGASNNFSGYASGGSGGRIFPGNTAAAVTGNTANRGIGGTGGQAGGGGGVGTSSDSGTSGSSGGGGGWGASGGTGVGGQNIPVTGATGGGGSAAGGTAAGNLGTTQVGAAGGKAVALNGFSVTWTSGNTTRVYGAVS